VLESVRQRVRGRTPVPGTLIVDRGSAPVVPIARGRRGKPSPAMVAAVVVPLAAAAAFALLWLRERGVVDDAVGKLAGLEKKLDESQRRERLTAGAMVAAQKKVEQLEGSLETVATPHLELATVKSPNMPVIKVLVDPENRRWVVMAFDLPPVPSDKDYQLWFLPSDKKAPPISAGLLAPGPGNTQFGTIAIPADVTNINGAAISLEPKGGSKQPTQDQIKTGGPFI
jgi:anti-sigma-K factor RskA